MTVGPVINNVENMWSESSVI